ncbi:rcc01693 family protein [Frigidibacter sp.]|uniref:rcc01693 family protein n=1 Tax=Frigidibacter sp. TaxID=2586418 RepID=UPI002733648A|nr:rcc01693 family protein [Frigidibacter sp.]MDP3339665.1 phage tail assembly chaperone [Frigidibacter sp.]
MDWPGLMRAGLRGLGLMPEQFWRLTPAELAIMLGAEAGAGPLTRARLEDLARRWPDLPAARAGGPDLLKAAESKDGGGDG